jgi:hypothetical protein
MAGQRPKPTNKIVKKRPMAPATMDTPQIIKIAPTISAGRPFSRFAAAPRHPLGLVTLATQLKNSDPQENGEA